MKKIAIAILLLPVLIQSVFANSNKNVGISVSVDFTIGIPYVNPLSSEITDSTQLVSWTTVSPLLTAGFVLEQANNPDFSGSTNVSDWMTDTSKVFTYLSEGTYCYRVKAKDLIGNETSWSNVTCSLYKKASSVSSGGSTRYYYDYCPNGDYTASNTDGSCGSKPQPIETPPVTVNTNTGTITTTESNVTTNTNTGTTTVESTGSTTTTTTSTGVVNGVNTSETNTVNNTVKNTIGKTEPTATVSIENTPTTTGNVVNEDIQNNTNTDISAVDGVKTSATDSFISKIYNSSIVKFIQNTTGIMDSSQTTTNTTSKNNTTPLDSQSPNKSDTYNKSPIYDDFIDIQKNGIAIQTGETTSINNNGTSEAGTGTIISNLPNETNTSTGGSSISEVSTGSVMEVGTGTEQSNTEQKSIISTGSNSNETETPVDDSNMPIAIAFIAVIGLLGGVVEWKYSLIRNALKNKG